MAGADSKKLNSGCLEGAVLLVVGWFLVFVVLGMEHRTSPMLGKRSTTVLHSQPKTELLGVSLAVWFFWSRN